MVLCLVLTWIPPVAVLGAPVGSEGPRARPPWSWEL